MGETLSSTRWKPIVEEFMASGLTVTGWCREHGVGRRRLCYWIAGFKDEEEERAGQTG
jgi:hypothetical protein